MNMNRRISILSDYQLLSKISCLMTSMTFHNFFMSMSSMTHADWTLFCVCVLKGGWSLGGGDISNK
jgi:hypothetical protein